MGYDRFPEGLIDEKRTVLDSLVAKNARLVFTHDPVIAIGRLTQDEKGRFSVTKTQEKFERLAS